MSPRRQNLLLLLASLTFSLLAAEAVLRMLEPGRPWQRKMQQPGRLWQVPAWVFDAHVGARFSADWKGTFSYKADRPPISVDANRWGFRSPDVDRTKAPGTRRIALLGDSLFAALQVEAEHHVRRRLEVGLTGTSEVLNFAVPGTGPVAHLNVYRHFARHFDPDTVVLGIYTANDFTDDRGRRWQDADGNLVERPFVTAPGDLRKIVKANSALAMAIWSTTWKRAAEPEREPAPSPSTTESPQGFALAGVSEQEVENKLAIWNRLAGEVEQDGRRLVVVLFPQLAESQDGGARSRNAAESLHQAIRDRIQRPGVSVLTGGELLDFHHRRVGDVPWGKAGDYLSEAGHASLAELLLQTPALSEPATAGPAQLDQSPTDQD